MARNADTADVSVRGLSKWLRRPWHRFWRWVERTAYHGRSYSLLVPQGKRIYTPWYESRSEFADLMREIRRLGPVSVPRDRCYLLYAFCARAARMGGDIVECGVWTGGTAHLLAETVRRTGGRLALHLFDTFEGMPSDVDAGRDYHSPGDFSDTSVQFVRDRLRAYPFVALHQGRIPDTFKELDPATQFSLVHVDVDVYEATLASCEFFWPRLNPGALMIFDDYGFFPYRRAERLAVDEFFQGRLDRPISLPTGQAIVIKSQVHFGA
jgi:O-methyltransferase